MNFRTQLNKVWKEGYNATAQFCQVPILQKKWIVAGLSRADWPYQVKIDVAFSS